MASGLLHAARMVSSRCVWLVVAALSLVGCGSSSLGGPAGLWSTAFEAEIPFEGYERCGSSYRIVRVPSVGTMARLVLEDVTPKRQPLSVLVEDGATSRVMARAVMSGGDHVDWRLSSSAISSGFVTYGIFILPNACLLPGVRPTEGVVIHFRYRLEVRK
jgi:hypothetical protein